MTSTPITSLNPEVVNPPVDPANLPNALDPMSSAGGTWLSNQLGLSSANWWDKLQAWITDNPGLAMMAGIFIIVMAANPSNKGRGK